MAVKDKHRGMLEKVADDDAWSLGLSADWEGRLAADPRSTLATLRQLYGKSAAKTPAVEGLYWRALLQHVRSEEEMAAAVLRRLDPMSSDQERLLDLKPRERDLLFEHLKKLAEQLLEDADADPDERRRAVAEPPLLGEIAFEEQGRRGEAAAFYALAHDRVSGQAPENRFRRLLLCFLLCRSRIPREERRERKIQPFVTLARRAVEAVDYTLRDEKVPDGARQYLRFELYHWLGDRQMILKQHQQAAEDFQRASFNATNDEVKVDSVLRLVAALEAQGKLQEAYSEMLEVQEEADRVKDASLRQWWRFADKDLRGRLGGGVVVPDLSIPDEGGFLESQEVFEHVLSGDKNADDMAGNLEENLRHILQTPPANPVSRHRVVLQLSLVVLAREQFAEVDALLQQAEELETQLDDEKPKFQRQLLLARRHAHAGDTGRAAEIFADLFPQAQQDSEDLPVFLGHYLEALVGNQDSSRVEELVDPLLIALERLLRRQPTDGARRSIRRLHQRPFEAAVNALTQTAIRIGITSDAGQSCLAKTWSVLGAARNLELHWKTQMQENPEHAARLRQLEGAFHGQLRRNLTGDTGRSEWTQALNKIFQYEASVSRDFRLPGFDSQKPSANGISVAFFEYSDLFHERQLLVLGYCQGTYYLGHVDADMQRRLVRWRNRCSAAASVQPRTLRDLYKGPRKPSPSRNHNTEPPTIADVLPNDLRRFFRRISETEFETFRSPTTPEPVEAGPWYIFPSGVIHSLPFEMLPEPGVRSDYFGNRRAVHLCLRAAPADSVPVKLNAGWLGLGGVPGLEGSPDLKGTLEEIDTLASWLREQGFGNVERLTGSGAHGRALEERLTAERPTVLHLATHGIKDEEHPEACTLVLAPAPGRPEGDLLPFRRIRQLPADGIELVILSACSSLIGRSDHSAGMEGLAWAFLQAGAKQVIASRYPVEDAAALEFMRKLYESLLERAPAEALGRTRDECLRQGMNPVQVGAWSLWS